MRSAEMATFTMMMRTHEGNRPDNNWQFDSDDETLDHLANMVDVHLALKPYLKHLSDEYYELGIPPIRGLFLHYENDPESYKIKFQYLFGKDLLIAPVIKPKCKMWKVYLPNDNWIHFWTGKEFRGGWIDLFIFKHDGTYTHSPQHGGAFAGLLYSMLTQQTILNATAVSQSFGLCYTAWTPQASTFTLNEKKDLAITTVTTDGNTPTDRVYKDVMTLTFTANEFIGFMDFTRECIIQEITPSKMRLVMFVSTTQKAYYNKPSYAIILTFETVS